MTDQTNRIQIASTNQVIQMYAMDLYTYPDGTYKPSTVPAEAKKCSWYDYHLKPVNRVK
jgi:hypothetical protein